MRLLITLVLGWFFMATYGSVTKHAFHERTACEAARTEVLNALGAINVRRISPTCREDVAPPKEFTFSGEVTTTSPMPVTGTGTTGHGQ